MSTEHKLVLIEWVDSYGCSSDWRSIEGCDPKPTVCRSVGWLVHEDEKCKTIVPHICEQEGQGCGDMTIPTEAIKSVVALGQIAPREVSP